MLHHKLGPSSSSIWLNCPGSVAAQRDFPNTSNPAADEGTAAHELAEKTLKSDEKNCHDFIGQLMYVGFDKTEYFVDEDMAEYVQEYVDYVLDLVEKKNGKLFVESQVSTGRIVSPTPYFIDKDEKVHFIYEGGKYEPESILPITETRKKELIKSDLGVFEVQYTDEGFGTSDAIVISEHDMDVCDLKYGKGVAVFAEENSQGMMYGIGSYDEYSWLYEVGKVIIHIIQPRLDSISKWAISTNDLLEWADESHTKYLLTLDPNAPRIPGDKQCRWCRANKTCTEFLAFSFQDMIEDFDEYDSAEEAITKGKLIDKDETPLDVLATINLRSTSISTLLKGIKADLTDKAKTGIAIPEHKLVAGKGSRSYLDESKAKAAFSRKFGLDVVAPRALLSPAKMEKMKDKSGVNFKNTRLFKSHVQRHEGSPVLAPADDNRKEVSVNVDDDFADMDTNEDLGSDFGAFD